MKKVELLLVVLACIGIFVLVYSPHFSYPWPLHVDEWHHISEAKKLESGEYTGGSVGYRAGFHIILLGISKLINLASWYQYFPAIWAVISGLTLFYVVNKKTKNFLIAFFSMIFFASLKSNVNILGLWFFTPLTFSIPFIFLYTYWFSEGFLHKSKKYLLYSLGIMIFLVFVYPLSVLFALPFLLAYGIFNLSYLRKEWKFFSLFLIIPFLGIILFSIMNKISMPAAIGAMLNSLIFPKGWGVLELNNSFFEIYSLTGYVFAAVGFGVLFMSNKIKKFSLYLLWPFALLFLIILYKILGFSYFSPYQRNFYYFALSLPFLSAVGLNSIMKIAGRISKGASMRILQIIFIAVVFFFSFLSYYKIPEQVQVYHVIGEQDYEALQFLSSLEKGRVMANAEVSTAVYALTGQEPVAALYFYGDRSDVDEFFSGNCALRKEIIEREGVKYILSSEKIDCDWKELYNKQERYLYNTA